jgi:hypothetical protein
MAAVSISTAPEARPNGHVGAHGSRRVSKGERERQSSAITRIFPSGLDEWRQPPHSIELEQSVVGACLLDNDEIDKVSVACGAEDFFVEGHRALWGAMIAMRQRGEKVDALTLGAKFRSDWLVDGQRNPTTYLGHVAAQAPSIRATVEYGHELRRLTQRRQAILIGEDQVGAAYDLTQPIAETLSENRKRFEALERHGPVRHSPLAFAQDLPVENGMPDIVAGLLPAKSTAAVFGASRSAKTFFVVALLNSVARGAPFLGRDTEEGSVLYVPLEGRHGVAKRILAAEREYGQTNNRLAVLQATGTLGTGPQSSAFADTIIAASRELTAKSGVRNAVICIDTLSRALGGEDENAAGVMTAAINHAERITAATGATVIFVHHCGKDKERGMRGSYALFAGLDAVLEIEHDGQEGTPRAVTIQKAKDGPEGPAAAFTLRTVEVGRDTRGRPITSCVIQEAEHPGAPRRRKVKPGSAAGKALNELHQIVAGDGGSLAQNHPRAPSGVRLVPLDEWRTACRRRRLGAGDTASEGRAFLRAVEVLSDAGAIGEFGGTVWLLSRHDQTKMGTR